MDFEYLACAPLFRGMSPEEGERILGCLQAEKKRFEKGTYILREGDTVRAVGLVCSGAVNIERDDFWGNRAILEHAGEGQIFAETYACIPGEPLTVNVVAAMESEILFLDVQRMLTACGNACAFHNKLIRNLLTLTAEKNLRLSSRMAHIAPKSIRGRVMAYLSELSVRQGGQTVTVPFDRQQMTDYLGVERSALSGELSRMRTEGILDVRKNVFRILG